MRIGAHPLVRGHRQCVSRCPAPSRTRLRTQAAVRTIAKDVPGLKPEAWTGAPEQEQALRTLRARFNGPNAAPSDDVLRWYLRDRYFDVAEAESKLRTMLRWQKDFRPELVTAEAVAKEYASGKAYVHQHTDVYGRPAIVIRCKRHKIGEYPTDDSKRLCVHLIDKAIRQAEAAGGEQIIGIFDLRGFQVTENADFVFAKFMVDAFFEYYPRRVGQVLFVDAPWVFQPAWAVIKPLMRKYAALVRFVSTEELKTQLFTSNTVPADFQ